METKINQKEELICPVCRIEFTATNPSRRYCYSEGCKETRLALQSTARSIKNSKRRKLAVEEIHDYLNG